MRAGVQPSTGHASGLNWQQWPALESRHCHRVLSEIPRPEHKPSSCIRKGTLMNVTFLLWRFSQVITIIRWQSSPYEWHVHYVLIFQFLLFFKDRISYMYSLYCSVIWMCCVKTAQWVGLGSVKTLNLITTQRLRKGKSHVQKSQSYSILVKRTLDWEAKNLNFHSSSISYFYICCCLVAQLCLSLCNPLDYSSPGSSVHGILQARILEWVAISFSRDLPHPGIEP